MDFVIGGIGVAGLIFGIVEAAKAFGIEDKGSQALALVSGFVLVGVSSAIGQELIPEVYVPWITLVVTALAGALAANGWYDFLNKRTNKHEDK